MDRVHSLCGCCCGLNSPSSIMEIEGDVVELDNVLVVAEFGVDVVVVNVGVCVVVDVDVDVIYYVIQNKICIK